MVVCQLFEEITGEHIHFNYKRGIIMKISLSIGAYGKLEGERNPTKFDAIRQLASAGYKYVDICFYRELAPDFVLGGDDWEDWIVECQKVVDECRVKVNQAHAPIFNPLSPDITERDRRLEMVRRSIIAAARLGAKWIVLHPGTNYYDNRHSVNLQSNIEYYRPMLALAKEVGIGIAIENLFDTHHVGSGGSSEKTDRRVNDHIVTQRRYCSQPEELIELVDTLAKEYDNVGICWDFGHANEASLDHVKSLELIGKRLKALHVNDNNNVFDDHLMPYEGTVPWNEVMPTLKRIGYKGDFTYECTHCFAHMPNALHGELLKFTLKMAKYMISLAK